MKFIETEERGYCCCHDERIASITTAVPSDAAVALPTAVHGWVWLTITPRLYLATYHLRARLLIAARWWCRRVEADGVPRQRITAVLCQGTARDGVKKTIKTMTTIRSSPVGGAVGVSPAS